MTKKTDTWMPLYVGDYLADTGRLTTEGHGAYLLLLMDYWRNGPPPDNDEQLASIVRLPLARWKKLRPNLALFFQIEAGLWRQKRAEQEMHKAGNISSGRSAAANARWEKERIRKSCETDANAHANGHANEMQNALPSQSHPQSESKPLPSVPVAERPSAAAVGIADKFVELRSKLWPNESALASAGMTLNEQAQQYLDAGGSVDLINEIVAKVMRNNLLKGDSAPRDFKFCRLSMATAIRNHSAGPILPRAAPKPPRPQTADAKAELDQTMRDAGFAPEQPGNAA